MIVGENPKPDDIEVNVCREKHLTAIRSSGADEKLTLITPVQLSLEEAIEFINEDELIEITPKSIRLRKTILDMAARKRIQAQKRAALKEQGK
jgi:GTP-binding protein